MNIEISSRVYNDLNHFCKFNELDVNPFAEKLIVEGLAREKYGEDLMDNISRNSNEETIQVAEDKEVSIEVPSVDGAKNPGTNEKTEKPKKVRIIKTKQ